MNRKKYQPTNGQLKQWARLERKRQPMPTDEEFKADWKKAHHGKERGWGIGKNNWVLADMTRTEEYNIGIWQGRVDFVCGLEYQEKLTENDMENATSYNLGYHRGYTECESNMRGFDQVTRDRLLSYES